MKVELRISYKRKKWFKNQALTNARTVITITITSFPNKNLFEQLKHTCTQAESTFLVNKALFFKDTLSAQIVFVHAFMNNHKLQTMTYHSLIDTCYIFLLSYRGLLCVESVFPSKHCTWVSPSASSQLES